MSWLVEIEDSSLVWQDVCSNRQVRSIVSGTSNESQVIPDFSLSFVKKDIIPAGLLDPETNRDRARLRITDGSTTRYFRIERQPGSVDKGLDYPQISGRSWAGIITEFRPLTYDFTADIYASDMARLICTQHPATRSGEVVGVVWLSSIDPVIPGGRFQASRRDRLELLKELVRMCGAKLRVSKDGLNFEVYDRPSMALTESVTRTFTDAKSLSYEMQRVKQPGNAIRVQGEQVDYTRPTLPFLRVSVDPTAINANGTDTATASATVYDSAGLPVQHKAIIDEAITAGSYTAIPVSGCYSVAAVWLNTGTQSAPVKGSRVTPTSFTASEITVPDNSTQLFIVSYTQAESVSWNLSDQGDEIKGEAQTTTGALAVSTTNAIGRVTGVYLATDTNRSGVNYFTGGSYTANTTSITLGITPGATGTAVIIDYEEYNGSPLSASISPSTALCDATGQCTATIGAGSTVGTAKITASALGQENSAWLSLLGSSIDSIALTSDKAQILVGSTVEGQTAVSETNLTVRHDTLSSGIALEGYVVVGDPVAGSVTISSALTVKPVSYKTVGSEHRIYMKVTGDGQYFTIGTTTVDVAYNTAADVENSAGTATITASVTQSDDSPVSDGTPVQFSLSGFIAGSCSLDSTTEYTSSGEASVELTAGQYPGFVTVTALCGSQKADLRIEVVRTITDDDGVGTVSYPTGIATYPGSLDDPTSNTSTSADDPPADTNNGTNICGSRRLVGCEGEPLANVWVALDLTPSVRKQTDGDGWFTFCVPEAGTYTGTAELPEGDETFSWTVADPSA